MQTCQTNIVHRLRKAAILQDAAGLSDGQLLDCFLERHEEAAFEALVRRHGPMVLGVCRRIVSNAHDAEDAFQATFLVLLRKAPSLRLHETLGNWLYGVAYHTALKARAANWKRRAKELEVKDMARPNSPPADARSADAWQDVRRLLDEEFLRLPDKYREAVVLCDLESKTRAHAARQLDIPEGTLSGRLTTARKLLAKRLARRGVSLSGGALAAAIAQNAAAAGLPTSLLLAVVKTATLVAAGNGTAAGAISAKVAALTTGVLNTMSLTKLKIGAGIVGLAIVMGLGATVLSGSGAQAPGVDAGNKNAAPTQRNDARVQDNLEKAAKNASNIQDAAQKAYALMTIGTAQASAGDRRGAAKSFEEAVRAAQAIQAADEYRKGATLMFVAKAQADAGEVEAALKTAADIQTKRSNAKEWAQAHIARAQAEAGDVKGALETADAIAPSGQDLALALIAAQRVKAGDLKEAASTADRIQDDSYKVEALTALALAQTKAKDPVAAQESLERARKSANALEDNNRDLDTSRKAHALVVIAMAKADMGDLKAALAVAEDLRGSNKEEFILVHVAQAHVKSGKTAVALEIVDKLRDGLRKAEVLAAVARAQAQTRDFKAAHKTIDTMPPVSEKIETLLSVAALEMKAGEQAAAVATFDEAIKQVKNPETLWYDEGPMCATPMLLHRMMMARAEAGDEKGALTWANQQTSAFVRSMALAGVAQGMAKRK